MELVHHIEPENEIKSRPKKINFTDVFGILFMTAGQKFFLKSKTKKTCEIK